MPPLSEPTPDHLSGGVTQPAVAVTGSGVLTFGSLTDQLGIFLRGLVSLWTLAMIAGAILLFWNGEAYAIPFAIVAAASLIALTIWKKNTKGGIPFLLFITIQQGVVFLMPLYIANPGLLEYTPEVVMTSALAIALFLALLPLGWMMGIQQANPLPSRLNISADDRENAHVLAMRIAMALLSVALMIEMVPFFVHLGGLVPVLSAGSGAAATLGAMLGGYAIGVSGKNKSAFWILLALLFFVAIRDVLISAASSFVIASILGLALGSRKIPWMVLVIVIGLLTFLSAGKFTLREKYWKESNTTGVTLTGLPALYAEWSRASMVALQGKEDQATLTAREVAKSDSGSFGQRINNFVNMAFVVRALENQRISPLYGATYAVIPPLFIPRILWPTKPRAHAGQILLNVHFERQREVDTERTFIAWGLLSEAVGNFGVWGGAAFLGIVLGYLLGYLETWSRLKELFSVEGLILMGLWLKLMVSYEMVSSVFLTSTFQMLVVIAVGGGMLRSIFGKR